MTWYNICIPETKRSINRANELKKLNAQELLRNIQTRLAILIPKKYWHK